MNSVYLAALVALVLAAFVLGRNRAVVLASASKGKGVLHSLPVYHGLLAAASVFTAMLLIYAVGTPLTEWLARTSALTVLPGDIAADDLKRGAALRDISSIAAGRQSMGTATPILQEAAQVYARA